MSQAKTRDYTTTGNVIYLKFEKKSQNPKVKKVNSVKPKGDIELKNIFYRIYDKRYVGRKSVKGKSITVYAKTQKECYDKLRAEIKKVEIKDKTPTKQRVLFETLYQSWYQQEKEPFVVQKTNKDIQRAFNQLAPLHKMSIQKITKQDIIDVLSKMKDNGTKEKTRLYLNACLRYYLNEGVIKVNPCANVKIKKSHNRKDAFTFEEQKLIIENLTAPLKPVILIYFVTGMRKNEFNFRSIEKDIDFDNKILKAVNLKGRNQIKRFKQIKLSDACIKLIMNNLDIIHKFNPERVYRMFTNFLETLNIKNKSLVNCRHSFATNCMYLGKPDVIISREMGHSRTQLAKDVYTDVDYHLSAEKIHILYGDLYAEI